MKKISTKEWRWAAIFSAAVMALTCVPYLVGAARSGDDGRFSGFVIGVEDGNSYLAKMQLGAHGQWLFQLPYAIEDHPKSLVYSFYILLGKLAGWVVGTADPLRLHDALVFSFHAARVACGFGLLLTSYAFVAELLPRVRQRRLALMLVALGGGLGWLALALQLPGVPLEFYSPEAFTFLDLYSLPHLAAARMAMLGGLLFYMRAVRATRAGGAVWRWLIAAAGAWALLTFIQPFYMIIVYVILAMHIAILGVFAFRETEGALTRGLDMGATAVRALWVAALAGLAGAPMVLYTFLLMTADPVYQTWGAQNVILSPAPWYYALAWGLLAVPAVFGLRSLYRRNVLAWALVAGWLAAVPVLLYVPYNLQRRFAEGAQVPLVALAVLGLTAGLPTVKRLRLVGRRGWRYASLGLVALSLPATMLLWVGGIVGASQPAHPMFQNNDQVATYVFLARSVPPRSVVLSSYQFGNAAPAYGYVVAFAGHGPETPHLDTKLEMVAQFYDPKVDAGSRRDSFLLIGMPYVVIGPFERELGAFDPADPKQADYLQRIFQSGDYSVWSLKTGP
ncbi:MAG: hypothetical protein HY872_09450 [Chloroflexi bacterium]|nr:hypothetical protein [Chloroflexota bacterium]